MKLDHTPGPLRVRSEGYYYTILPVEPGPEIGQVFKKADAKLYAAAPDIFNALVELAELLLQGKAIQPLSAVVFKEMPACKAIEKATGRHWGEVSLDSFLEKRDCDCTGYICSECPQYRYNSGVCIGDRDPVKDTKSKHTPDIIEALIDLVVDGINHYHLYPNSHRKTAREYYSVEIKIIESATGKTWEELSE